MKRVLAFLTAVLVLLLSAMSVSAADGNVTYDGKAQEFIFEPGSEYSPTDLFPNFKGVMPGDSITQKISVKNDVEKGVKVKIYMRSLGAHEDSVEFLSQLKMTVTLLTDTNLFDAMAHETAQLTEWTYLGMLYSGGEAELEVKLDVPVTVGNEYQEQVGYLDWEFRIEEFPREPDDPAPPTGDTSYISVWIASGIGAVAAVMIIIFIIVAFKRKKEDDNGEKTHNGQSDNE